MTRPGAILLVPAMALWMLTFTNWGTFGRRAAFIVAAVAGPFLFSELLGALFGKPGVAAGWNAAYMACELATGHEWFECAEIVKSRGINTDDPAAFAMALYTIAREAFTADPSVTWHTLSANVSAFLYHCSLQILGGYLVTPRFPSWVFEYFLIALIPGIAFHIWRASWRDYLFWLLTTVAVLVSAAAIFKHDGWCALTGSHPLIALGLCIGWRDMRGRRLPPTEMPLRTMFAGLSLTAVALLAVPAFLHALLAALPSDIYFGGRIPTGFIVVEDGAANAAYKGTPTRTIAAFGHLVEVTNLEQEWGLFLDPMSKSLPFAVFWTPRLGQPEEPSAVYLGPRTS